MKKTFFYTTIITFITFLSCQNNQQTSHIDGLPIIDLGKAKDSTLLDVKFALESSRNTDSLLTFIGKAKIDGQEVGIQIEMNTFVPVTDVDKHANIVSDTLIANAVTFRSIGPPSDYLLNSLAARFGIIQNKTFTLDGLKTSIFSLRNKEKDIQQIQDFCFTVYLPEQENTYDPMMKVEINKAEKYIAIKELNDRYRYRIIELLSK